MWLVVYRYSGRGTWKLFRGAREAVRFYAGLMRRPRPPEFQSKREAPGFVLEARRPGGRWKARNLFLLLVAPPVRASHS